MSSRHNGAMTVHSHVKGTVFCTPRRRKVAIVGSGRSHVEAPMNDPSWEVWGCNSLWKYCQDAEGHFRADRWFELHPMNAQTEKEMDAIRECPIPIYTLLDESDWCKNSAQFPMEWIITKVSEIPYYTCTIAYQIALAVAEEFEEIGLYGMEFHQGTAREQTVEQACVDYWIGLARGKGIVVHVPDGSRLGKQDLLYGYEYQEEKKYVEEKMAHLFFTQVDEMEQAGTLTRMGMVSEHMKEGHA